VILSLGFIFKFSIALAASPLGSEMLKWRQSLVVNKMKFVDQGKTTPASSWLIADSNQERVILVRKS
jgi:hypothetical protein